MAGKSPHHKCTGHRVHYHPLKSKQLPVSHPGKRRKNRWPYRRMDRVDWDLDQLFLNPDHLQMPASPAEAVGEAAVSLWRRYIRVALEGKSIRTRPHYRVF